MKRQFSTLFFPRSFFRVGIAISVILLQGSIALSQSATRIYYDSSADTIKAAALILQNQLSKAGVDAERSSNNFNYNGILLSAQPWKWKAHVKNLDKLGPEACAVVSTGKSVLIVGNSQLAVRHGIFIYLEKLGFRYYFPNPDWYIIPKIKQLYPPLNYKNAPSFDHRRIWYGYGTGSKIADANYQFWFMANRLGGSLDAVIGHAYDDIVVRNSSTFKAHPEWLYPRPNNGVLPVNPKFDLANEELVQFVINDVLKRLEKAAKENKPLKMVTLCPSDGLGTCDSKACQRFGTITDRVYSLINRAARVVNERYPGTWISGMAYSEYSAPPTRKLEPNTFVSIATAYNYTKYSTDQLISEWSKKAGKVGVYDYLGLYAWDFDLPGQSQASQADKVIKIIQKYYRMGAKGYDAETTPGAINTGLGHYLISRTLWDASISTESLKKEFFSNCFSKAAPIMTQLWNEWQRYPYDMVRESDLAEWIDLVDKAESIQNDKATKSRLDQVRTYLHYLFLYNTYRKSNSEQDLVNLLTYSYNTLDIGSTSGYAALFILGNTSSIPGLKFNDPAAKYRKPQKDLSELDRVTKLVNNDRKSLKIKNRITVQASSKEFKSPPLNSLYTEKKYIGFKNTTAYTGMHSFVLKLNNKSSANYLNFAGGFVLGGGSSKPITLSFYPYNGTTEVVNDLKPLLQVEYTLTTDTQRISLASLPKGVYLLKVDDPSKKFIVNFSNGISYSVMVTPSARLNAYSRYLWFYVPKGTKSFRIFKQIETTLISPAGRKLDFLNKKNEEIDVIVEPGEEGLWVINFLSGYIHIEGIPPFLGQEPERMLIPVNY